MGLRHLIGEQGHAKAATVPQPLGLGLETATTILPSFSLSAGLAACLLELWLCPEAPRAPLKKQPPRCNGTGMSPTSARASKGTDQQMTLSSSPGASGELPRLPSLAMLLSGEQRTPTSSACEQSCCPQLLWGQSRRDSSVPTHATSSSKIKPWSAA